jgi:cytochrome c biogenesis protein ResB
MKPIIVLTITAVVSLFSITFSQTKNFVEEINEFFWLDGSWYSVVKSDTLYENW